MADISQEDFASAMKKMNASVGQLRMKEGALYSTLAKTNPKLAFQLRDAKSSDEAFQLLADAIARETNAQKRAVLMQAAFGKSGQALIPMMGDLAKLRADAQASGSIISDDDVKSCAAMDENLKRLKATGLAISNQVLGQLAEKLAPVLDRFRQWADVNKGIISSKIDNVLDGIGKGLEFVTRPGVLSGIASLAVGIKALGVACMIFGAGNPLVLLIGGLVGLITLIVTNWDKITGFFQRLTGGKGSMVGMSQYDGQRQSTSPQLDQANALAASMGYPVSPNLGAIAATSSSTTSRAIVDINIPNIPQGGNVRQRGAAPGVTLATGRQMSGGAH